MSFQTSPVSYSYWSLKLYHPHSKTSTMKVLFCLRSDPVDTLKNKSSTYKMSKIKPKFGNSKFLSRREFSSVENIHYLSISEFGEIPKLAELYDKIMNRQVFEVAVAADMCHLSMFQAYKDFNTKFYENIKNSVDEDDLIIINDSSLFLLPSMIKARVAFRDLHFDGGYIERVPFYSEILKNLCVAQKFFDNRESLESFEEYMETSYDTRDINQGGCWYIKPYVDKFIVIDTLEHLIEFIRRCNQNPGFLYDESLEERYSQSLMKYFYTLKFPKIQKSVLTNINLLYIEPFIKKNPDVHVRYLRTGLEFNEETDRMIQYLNKMYTSCFSVADTVEYAHVVAEIFYCDIFIGEDYKEIAYLLGRPVVGVTHDPFKLADEIYKAIECSTVTRYDVLGEEEYLKEIMNINGYETILQTATNDDLAIKKLTEEITGIISFHNDRNAVYYRRAHEDGLYIKKGIQHTVERTESYYPVVYGKNTYLNIKKRKISREIEPLNRESAVEYWKKSKRTILLDYDGVLTPIINDRNKAVMNERTKETLIKLAKSSRVVICSGRTRDKLDEWIPKEIEVYGEHGFLKRVNGEWTKMKEPDEILGLSLEIMNYFADRTPGAEIEQKEAGLTFHYRNATLFNPDKLYTLLKKIAGNMVDVGKMVVEVKGAKKDYACKEVEPTICIGDDRTDEDMFRECTGISIKVGEGISLANGYLKDVDEVTDFLNALAE